MLDRAIWGRGTQWRGFVGRRRLLAGVGCGGACGGGCRAAKGGMGAKREEQQCTIITCYRRGGIGHDQGKEDKARQRCPAGGCRRRRNVAAAAPRARRRGANKMTQAWRNTGGGRGCSRRGGGAGRQSQVPAAGPAASGGWDCCWGCWHRRARRPAAPSDQYGRGGSRRRGHRAPKWGG